MFILNIFPFYKQVNIYKRPKDKERSGGLVINHACSNIFLYVSKTMAFNHQPGIQNYAFNLILKTLQYTGIGTQLINYDFCVHFVMRITGLYRNYCHFLGRSKFYLFWGVGGILLNSLF